MPKSALQKKDVEIRRIRKSDQATLLEFFAQLVFCGLDRTFHPHSFTEEVAYKICTQRMRDWYAGVFLQQSRLRTMVAYVMLRGWDAGYEVPSFGLCVLPDYQRVGLGRLLLEYAVMVARFRGSPAVRLKVYPDNIRAVEMYRAYGFQYNNDLENGQLVGYFRF